MIILVIYLLIDDLMNRKENKCSCEKTMNKHER